MKKEFGDGERETKQHLRHSERKEKLNRNERDKAMKYLLLAILLLFAGCSTKENDEAASAWIAKARKPIVCINSVGFMSFHPCWTLIDANAKIFYTGEVGFRFPDTIKVTGDQNNEQTIH
jgi:hypothetical protein